MCRKCDLPIKFSDINKAIRLAGGRKKLSCYLMVRKNTIDLWINGKKMPCIVNCRKIYRFLNHGGGYIYEKINSTRKL